MPNWCQNIANITHEDLEKLDAIVEELKKEDPELFNSLVPNPAGEWQYDWSVANWGDGVKDDSGFGLSEIIYFRNIFRDSEINEFIFNSLYQS